MREASLKTAIRRFYRERKVLVTGGASFIGSHLCEALVAAGARVTAADDLSSGRVSNLSAISRAIRFRKGDLRRANFARSVTRSQDMVFHLAAAHGGRGYIESHPRECAGNVLLDREVFDAAASLGVKRIVYASSACVYPVALQSKGKPATLLAETDVNFDRPVIASADGAYGRAKLKGELRLRAVSRRFGIDAAACRLFTSYGERENESHSVIALIAKASARMDPYPIWGDGRQTRNFTYVQDTVTGMLLAGARLAGFHAINVGTSRRHTVLELIEEIFTALRWRPQAVIFERHRPVGVGHRSADNAKSEALLGWRSDYPFSKGIRRTAAWYKKTAAAKTPDELSRALLERASPSPKR